MKDHYNIVEIAWLRIHVKCFGKATCPDDSLCPFETMCLSLAIEDMHKKAKELDQSWKRMI